MSKFPVIATELKLAGSNERAVGANGELNASSKKDLLGQQQRFMTAASQGRLLAIDADTSRQLVASAFNSKEAHRVLAEQIGDALYMTANRQGFMRKFCTKVDTAQGSVPRFHLRNKNVVATWATSPTKVESQIIRDKWLTPPEVSLVSRPFIPQTELNQSSGDLLQEKFLEGVEATMVAEDRMWYNQAQSTVGLDNNLTVVSGQLTVYGMMSVVTNVTRWGLRAANLLVASDLWQDIIGQPDFYQAIDPVARHELLLTGTLGTMYGMEITTDAHRHPEHKVLNAGEFFVTADPLTHGAYSDRNGIESTPIDISVEQLPGRGFVIHESLALSVANSRSVAKGIRY